MKSVTSKEISEMVSGVLKGSENIQISGVESLKNASKNNIAFLANKKYTNQVEESDASVILVNEDYDYNEKNDKTFIICKDANTAFSKVIDYFAPPAKQYSESIHKSAVVADSAKIGKGVYIGANVVIEENVIIGDNSVIEAGCYIGDDIKIQDNCLIYPNVTIRNRSIIGNNVILHPGVVIGSDGFGFAPSATGIEKIPQVGIVQIDDNVEIGSNTTIDRARFGKTWIKHDVKIDNQVQIGHNVTVGEYSILVSQSGIAGSTTLEQGVVMAGKVGIGGHLQIGAGAQVGAAAIVLKDLNPKEKVIGHPAGSFREFAAKESLPKKVKKLTQKIKELELKING